MKIYRRIKKKICPNAKEFQREKYAKQQHPEVKVLITGLMQCKNYGDVVISDCTSYLIKEAAKESGIRMLKISKLDIRRQKDKKNLNRVRNSDLIVFPGGGFIKYKQENFPVEMGRIASRAEHYGIPVIYNAMGVEDYDENHTSCIEMQNMLNLYSNKYITSRDFHDLLNSTYLKDSALKAKRVADPAVYAHQVYGISRDKDSEVIGLGVARHGLFSDHGIPLSGEDMLSVWVNIISKLDREGIKWKLFTNGLRQDEEFLTDLLVRLGKENDRNSVALKAPETSQELVRNIASFSGLIATRMHANIIAFSLSIPSVAFVWNDKLRFFGASIDCSHRYLEYQKITDAEFVVETLKKAISEGYDETILQREKHLAYESIKEFIAPFAKDVVKCRRRDLTNIKTVCYGLPNLNSEKLNRELFENHIDYYITDDEETIGTTCLGKPVYSSKKLKKRFVKKPFVMISETVDYTPCAKTLVSYGYKERYDFVNMHAYKRYVFKKGDVFVDNTANTNEEK